MKIITSIFLYLKQPLKEEYLSETPIEAEDAQVSRNYLKGWKGFIS